MASISFNEDIGWVGPAWVLRSIATGLQAHGSFPSLRKDFDAVEEGVQYLDLTELSETERAEIKRVVPIIVTEVKKGGPDMLSDPSFYPGFLAAYEELERLVSRVW